MDRFPVVIIGAGPVGLAAAAHLHGRGIDFTVLEAGDGPGASMRAWAHVQLFSPWRYVLDGPSRDLLAAGGWVAPDAGAYPTGGDVVTRYLQPLADSPQIRPHVRYGARVTAVTRAGFDKLKTRGREDAPFALQVLSQSGGEEVLLARAVIDASGTWRTPNPLGANGTPALGERALDAHIAYGIPDVRGRERARYAGYRVLVVGTGHSAFNALLDLIQLREEAPGTQVTWAMRRTEVGQLFGGGAADALEARGALGLRMQSAVAAGHVRVETGARIHRLEPANGAVLARLADDRELGPFDQIVAATGFRPELDMLRELRLDLDDRNEAPRALAPLIDPNVHSCGSVPPHGWAELKHASEPGFYIVGMKSYGRAPTFLMLTGYEQVRSVVAAIAGDMDAALDVQLVLPETGVCSGPGGTCCTAGDCCTQDEIDAPGCCAPENAAKAGCCATGATGATGVIALSAILSA